jgi:DNA-directed RNA polymerase specialized sigma24 family protein
MNVFRNRYRRAKLAVRKAVGAAPPVDAFGAVDDRVSVSNTLARLTPKQRAAVVLTDLLGYSAEEAAGWLGIRGSTVRSCRRGGARLRFEFTAVTAMAEVS